MIAIGVDIGGTSIKGAFITDEGQILDKFSMTVDKETSPDVELGKLCDIINNMREEKHYEVAGIGIGIPGILNMDAGIIISSPNLPNWDGFNIAEYMSYRTGLKVEINNDANVAALGEARFGSGSQFRNLIMITLGTGVGGGVIIDGHLYDGNFHQGGELGHMVIEVNGRECGCGRKGCLEAYASATALIKETKKAMNEHPESLLHQVKEELGVVDARNAFMAAKRGDLTAINLVNEYAMYLGEGLINFCNIFRPEAIILSGGVANEGDYLFELLRNYLRTHTYGMKGSPKVKIFPAFLGYDSGKIGAASLILDK